MFYRVSGDTRPPADIAFAWRICLGGWKPVGPLTLSCVEDLPVWMRECWANKLLPAVAFAHRHARSAGVVAGGDSALNFGAVAHEASVAGGCRFLERFSRSVGDKSWRAYLREHDAGRAPGHLATCIGARAATFNLPLRQALALHLAVEALGAGIPLGGRLFHGILNHLPPPAIANLRAA